MYITISTILLFFALSFSSITVSTLHTASKNIIVVQLDGDSADVNSIPTLSGWTVNSQSPASVGRYSFVRDQERPSSGEKILVSHRIYLKLGEDLVSGSSYNISSPYGSTTLNYSDKSTWNESIKVNQVGYPSKFKNKYANFGIFAGDLYYQYIDTVTPPTFYVIDTVTKEVVHSGSLSFFKIDTLVPDTNTSEAAGITSGEYVFRMDLDPVPAGGPYYIVMPGFGRSHSFGIGDTYMELYHKTLMRGMYHQRCGIALEKKYTDYTRGTCHSKASFTNWTTWGASTNISPVVGSDTFPRKGGYHDAGDYDIRPMHTVIPILMFGYFEAFSSHFVDNQYSIPESGNGIPDFLDEAVWGMTIWYNLQVTKSNFPDSVARWGSVFQGIERNAHPGYGSSTDGRADIDGINNRYGNFEPSRSVTAEACGLFAQASRLIRPYDSKRADTLISRATLAHNWLVANDTSLVESQYMYCVLQMYLATAGTDSATNYNNPYHVSFRSRAFQYITSGGTYPDQYLAGNISASIKAAHFVSYLLTSKTKDSATAASLSGAIKTQADNGGYMGWTPQDGFPYAHGVSKFMGWGAATAQGRYSDAAAFMIVLSTTDSAKQHYYDYVAELANYPVGLNPLGQSFITGLGTVRPRSPLHLDSYWHKYGLRPGSTKPVDTLDNVPGITVYGPSWGHSGISYQRSVTKHLYPCYSYDNTNTYCQPLSSMPGLRRWTDGWAAVNINEFTTWETMVWNAVMTAPLYDASPTNVSIGQSVGAYNMSISSYESGFGSVKTLLKLSAIFTSGLSITFTVVNVLDATLLTSVITVQPDQSAYTIDVSSLSSGTFFLKANGLVLGTFTK